MIFAFKDLFTRENTVDVSVKVPGRADPFEFTIPESCTGKKLKKSVARLIGIRETWLYALQFIDESGHEVFLLPQQKVTVVKESETGRLELYWRMIYIPKDLDDLLELNTIRMCYEQTRQQILTDASFCPDAEVGQKLAQLAVTIDGRMEDKLHRTERQLMKSYLEVAAKLPRFGKIFFRGYSDQNQAKWMAVSPSGLHFYGPKGKDDLDISTPFSAITKWESTPPRWFDHFKCYRFTVTTVHQHRQFTIDIEGEQVNKSMLYTIQKHIDQLVKNEDRITIGLDAFEQKLVKKICADAIRAERQSGAN